MWVWRDVVTLPEHVTVATVFLCSDGTLVFSQLNREVMFLEQL